MRYVKMFIKYCLLIPIAIVYDALKWALVVTIPLLVKADEYLEERFNVIADWTEEGIDSDQ